MADYDQLLQEAIKRSIRCQIDLLELILPNNRANAVNAQLEAQEANHKEEIQKLLERLDGEMREREVVESKLIELSSENEEMSKEHKATMDTLKREMAEMKSSVELDKQELHRLQSENKELDTKLVLLSSRHQVELETIKAEKSALEAKIENLEAETVRDTSSDKAQLQENNTKISKQEINEIEFKLNEIKLNKALEEVRSKNSEIEAINAQLELSTRRINELYRDLEVMQKSDIIKGLKASHKRELELLKAELEEANKQLTESIDSGIRWQKEVWEVSWQKADLERNMFERAGHEFESLKAQFKAEKNELEAELTLLSLVHQVEIETNKSEFENEKSDLKKQIEQAKEDEKSALEGKIEQLKAMLTHVEGEKDRLEEQNETKSKENRKLVDELSLRTDQLEKEKRIKEKFQQDHASIYVETERLKEDMKAYKQELKLTQAKLLRAEIRKRINEEEEEEKTDANLKLKFDELLIKLSDLSLNHKRKENLSNEMILAKRRRLN